MSEFNIYKESSNTIFSAYSKSNFLAITYKPFKQFGKRFVLQAGETQNRQAKKFYMNLKEDVFAALLHYTNMLIKNVSLNGFHQFAFSQVNGVYKNVSISADQNNNPGQIDKAKFYLNVSEGNTKYGIPISFFSLIELNKLATNVLENRYETNIAYLREIATLSMPNNEGKEIYDAIKALTSNSQGNYNNTQQKPQPTNTNQGYNSNNVINSPNNNQYNNPQQNSQPQNNQSNNNGATERQIQAIMNLVSRNDKKHPKFEGMAMPDIERLVRGMSKSDASEIIGFYKNS